MYDDVVREVSAELRRQVDAVIAAGVDASAVIVDPGIGFAKLHGHNWALLTSLGEIARLGGDRPFPVLVGASRKSFLGSLLRDADGEPRPADERDERDGRRVRARGGRRRVVCASARRRCERRCRPGRRPLDGGFWAGRPGGRTGQRCRGGRPGPCGGNRVMSGMDGAAQDRISLLGLRAFGRHGVLDHERRDGQEFVVDAVLWVDTRQAAAADDLSLTVDYAAVAGQLAAVVSGEPVALIETLADRLAAACLSAHEAVREVEITVHKPHAPLVQSLRDVTVTIRRSRA